MELLYAEKLFDAITVGIHIIDSEGIPGGPETSKGFWRVWKP